MAEVDFYMFFGDIIPILVLALAGAIFIGIMMFLSVISRPRPKQSDLKLQTYECGEEPYEDRIGIQFNYQYLSNSKSNHDQKYKSFPIELLISKGIHWI